MELRRLRNLIKMRCKQCGNNNDWVERTIVTNIYVEKDKEYLLCKCGNRQDAI